MKIYKWQELQTFHAFGREISVCCATIRASKRLGMESNYHTWRLSSMPLKNVGPKIAATVASNTYAAVIAGQVEAKLARKHYILPFNMPVTVF